MPAGTPYALGRFRGSAGEDFCGVVIGSDVAELIAYVSSITPLRPGDLLVTGSPAGNGAHYGRYLREGDVMESTITGLGVQRNRCVQP